MATVLVKFGQIDITEAVETWEQVLDTRLELMLVPKRHGALVAEVPVAAPRQVRVKGRTQEVDKETLITTIDNMQRYLNDNRQQLFLFDDRFLNAYKKSFGYGYIPATQLSAIDFVIDFIADDPFFYVTNESIQTETITSGDIDVGSGRFSKTIQINNTGTAFVFIKVTVTADGGSNISRVTMSSSTLARTFDWDSALDTANGSGVVQQPNDFVADMGNFIITNDGAEDLFNFVPGSSFLWLEPGVNNITIDAEPSTWQFKFTNRYW